MFASVYAQELFHEVRNTLRGERGRDREWEFFGTKVFVVLAIRYQLVAVDAADEGGNGVDVSKVSKGSPFSVMTERFPRFLKNVADTLMNTYTDEDWGKVSWKL